MKIRIEKTTADYLLKEIENLRRRNEILESENGVMHQFFELTNALAPKRGYAHAPDRLMQAKYDIEKAISTAELIEPRGRKEDSDGAHE